MPLPRILATFILLIAVSGCTTFDKAKKVDILELRVRSLQREVDELRGELAEKSGELARLEREKQEELNRIKNLSLNKIKEISEEQDEELDKLMRAKEDLESSLAKELENYKAKLEMTERGLVITFLAEIFFDSGKAEVREEAKSILQNVSAIFNKDVRDSDIAIVGHTDNVPIKYSRWKSNWELSTARALAVLHNFIDDGAIEPQRLSAEGYGEYRPTESNDTTEGQQQNRRVEIVIKPSHKFKKVKPAQ